MTTVVKTREAHDFLALVPTLAGFNPRNSVVLVAFRGKRTCGAMRFNLPEAASEGEYRSIATTLVGMLCKLRGVDAVVPVVYTDDNFAGVERMPAAGFIAVLLSCAELSGFAVKDALCVAADGWGSYLDDDCPPNGRPLDALASSKVHQALPARTALRGVGDGGELPSVDFVATERVARLLDRYRRAIDDSTRDDSTRDDSTAGEEFDTELRLLEDPSLFAECALAVDPEVLDDSIAALLILCLTSPPMRDAIMLQWAFDLEIGDRVLDENDRFAAGEPVTGTGASALMWGDGPRPNPDRIEIAMTLLKALTVRAPRSARPPLLCMLGWLSWALGRSSLAGNFVAQAMAIERTYGLAEVLDAMLGAGHMPEWAFAIPDDDAGPSRAERRDPRRKAGGRARR